MAAFILVAAQAISLNATRYSVDMTMTLPAAAARWADEFYGKTIDTRIRRFDPLRKLGGAPREARIDCGCDRTR